MSFVVYLVASLCIGIVSGFITGQVARRRGLDGVDAVTCWAIGFVTGFAVVLLGRVVG